MERHGPGVLRPGVPIEYSLGLTEERQTVAHDFIVKKPWSSQARRPCATRRSIRQQSRIEATLQKSVGNLADGRVGNHR